MGEDQVGERVVELVDGLGREQVPIAIEHMRNQVFDQTLGLVFGLRHGAHPIRLGHAQRSKGKWFDRVCGGQEKSRRRDHAHVKTVSTARADRCARDRALFLAPFAAPRPFLWVGVSTQGEADLLAAWRVELEGSPYEAVRLLGRGGMGAVFEVVHRALGQRRVLKLVAEAGRQDLEDRLRFEAQTLARLEHPNLLKVHDLGTSASGRLYMITELLHGRTLKEELRARGVLTPRETIDIAVGVLDGLAAAHAAGVIHRDLKPDNIFLVRSKDGATHVKVIDFGIAKIVAIEGSVGAEMKVASQMQAVSPLLQPTRTGFLLGTPQVMAPEQLLAKPVDARSDLYALGAVIFRCLTGRLLFVEREIVDLAKAHVFRPPEPPSLVAAQPVPVALDAVVLKALAKSPAERHASAIEMANALRAIDVTHVHSSQTGHAGEGAPVLPLEEPRDDTATIALEMEHETFTQVPLPPPGRSTQIHSQAQPARASQLRTSQSPRQPETRPLPLLPATCTSMPDARHLHHRILLVLAPLLLAMLLLVTALLLRTWLS